MLYGDSCLVVFFESFDTPYSYTKIGHVSDTSGLADALWTGGAPIRFERYSFPLHLNDLKLFYDYNG